MAQLYTPYVAVVNKYISINASVLVVLVKIAEEL